MYWIIGIYITGIIWVIYEWINAPEGYEDATGFHYGTPDQKHDKPKRVLQEAKAEVE